MPSVEKVQLNVLTHQHMKEGRCRKQRADEMMILPRAEYLLLLRPLDGEVYPAGLKILAIGCHRYDVVIYPSFISTRAVRGFLFHCLVWTLENVLTLPGCLCFLCLMKYC